MKILLINPTPNKVFIETNKEPIGLAYLASAVSDLGQVKILDSLANKLSVDETLEEITNFKPDILGISINFSTSWLIGQELAQKAKEIYSNLIIIAGGNTATFHVDKLICNPSIDIIIKGEGEVTFRETIKAIINNKDLKEVKGLVFKEDGQIIHTSPREPIDNLDKIPFPLRNVYIRKYPYKYTIIGSRGCPNACIYCSSSAYWGHRLRIRSVENILQELDFIISMFPLSNYYFSFADDYFGFNHNRIKAICKGLKDLNEKIQARNKIINILLGNSEKRIFFDRQLIKWGCTTGIVTLNEDILTIMKDSGCEIIFLGIESGSERILKNLKRKYTLNQIYEIVNLCYYKLGIFPNTSFIIGLPDETMEDVNKTFELIERLPGKSGIFILTPFAGTPIVDSPEKYGLTITPHSPEKENSCSTLIKNNHLSSQELLNAYYKGLGICWHKYKLLL